MPVAGSAQKTTSLSFCCMACPHITFLLSVFVHSFILPSFLLSQRSRVYASSKTCLIEIVKLVMRVSPSIFCTDSGAHCTGWRMPCNHCHALAFSAHERPSRSVCDTVIVPRFCSFSSPVRASLTAKLCGSNCPAGTAVNYSNLGMLFIQIEISETCYICTQYHEDNSTDLLIWTVSIVPLRQCKCRGCRVTKHQADPSPTPPVQNPGARLTV